jgi:chitin synthase
MAFITYVILLTVTIMISKILYNGIIKFVHSGAIDKVSLAVAVLLILNVGYYLFILLLHLFTHPKEILQIITGYLSYMTYQGAYTHTMVIYSFCNIHDVSWGTKGGTGTA